MASVLKGGPPLPLPHTWAKACSNKNKVTGKYVKEFPKYTCNDDPMKNIKIVYREPVWLIVSEGKF